MSFQATISRRVARLPRPLVNGATKLLQLILLALVFGGIGALIAAGV